MYPHVIILTLYPVDGGIIIRIILLETNFAKHGMFFFSLFFRVLFYLCDGLDSELVVVCFLFSCRIYYRYVD